MKNNKDGKTIETTTKLNDLESVLNYCKVNKKSWSVNEYVVEQRAPAKDGTPQFNYKIYLQRKMDGEEIQKLFLQALSEKRPSWKDISPRKIKEDHLYVLGIPDLHIGRLAWGKETGKRDYDSKIAYETYVKAVKALMEPIENDKVLSKSTKVLFPIGNDYFHTDNSNDTTTAGTKVDTDTRWQKMFLTGSRLSVETITNIAKNHSVNVLMVPGNHDYERTFYLGEYLRAWFKDHPNVTIDNAPSSRKYFAFGKNLFGFTHGDKEKHSELPLLMAQEASKGWSQADNKIWMVGHLHTEIVKEFTGVKVYTLPALCAPDAWHASKGFTCNDMAAMSFLYGANSGLIWNRYYKAE